jgi:uncharacterized protein YdeI (YjbR/CyaY-like superfamily)
MNEDENLIESFKPNGQADWRKWLEKNHNKEDSVWLIYHKKESKIPSITHAEAVEEALCFGWIDSKRQKVDDQSFRQFFGKRKPKGMWSKINKATIRRLTKDGKMHKAGLDVIAVAKKNGAWTMLDEVEKLVAPPDLQKALKKNKGAEQWFADLTRSRKRLLLLNLLQAKTLETRQKRIDQVISTFFG